jgi:hypothetical protein
MTDVNTETTTPTKGKAKAKAKSKAKAKAPATPKRQLITVDPKALSTSVGATVLSLLSKTEIAAEKITAARSELKRRGYEALALTTQALHRGAKADPTFDPGAIFSGDKALKRDTITRARLILGVLEVAPVKDKKGNIKNTYVVPKSAQKYFPSPTNPADYVTAKGKDGKETRDFSDAGRHKETFRTNFDKLLRKCIQATDDLLQRNAVVSYDKDEQTLRLSGPSIKAQFGIDTVLVNERTTIADPKDKANTIELETKPSYQGLASHAAVTYHGVVLGKRGKVAQEPASDEDHFIAMCKSVISAINKIGDAMTDEQLDALTSLRSAIDEAM